MNYPDPTVAFGATIFGLLLMVPFIWLPLWAAWAGMTATAILYGVTAYRRGIVFTVVEMLTIVVFWPVAIGVVVIMKGRNRIRRWDQNDGNSP